MKIFLAADHAGFKLKEHLKPFVEGLGFDVEDCGAHKLDEADDYPDFVMPAARKAMENGGFAIVIGGSGQGEAMAANKVGGARAAVYYGAASPSPEATAGAAGTQTDLEGDKLDIIASARKHNDANVLSLGARFMSEKEAERAVKQFLETEFSGAERHKRRIQKLDNA